MSFFTENLSWKELKLLMISTKKVWNEISKTYLNTPQHKKKQREGTSVSSPSRHPKERCFV
jgi:hypothetical protein